MTAVIVSNGRYRMTTPVPVRFVHNDRFGAQEAIAADNFDQLLVERPDIISSFAENGDLCWTVQTFCRLREAGIGGSEIGTAPSPGRINLAKAKTLSRSGPSPGAFEVSIQADYPRILWAPFHIQQNLDLIGSDDALQYLWPQTQIRPRGAERSEVKRVGFFGKLSGNLVSNEAEWRRQLELRGFEFVAPPPDSWHDFSDIDVALAIRSFGTARHSHKPANKLINAWIAGVPFVGGSDSAFRQVGTAGVDHLLATTLPEALAQIERLRSDPKLYSQLAQAGRERARNFTVEQIAQQWVTMLEGPVAARYREWAAHPVAEARLHRRRLFAQSAVNGAKWIARKLLRREHER